jgi:23S rRNA (guanosine2251-2'-O)-methyltransferase
LGGETAGASHSVKAMADAVLTIPMQNGVESLNVAMTAVLVAYQGHQH